jgi:transposase
MQVKAFGRSLGIRNKNDRVDARVIANFAASNRPEASWVPEPERMQLRELLQEREALVKMQADERKRPVGEVGVVAEVRQGLLQHLASGIARLETAMNELIDQHPAMKVDMKRFMTAPGIGPVTAISVLAILGDVRRFQRGRQLAAYVGVSPRQKTSGTSVRGRTRMCKQGNSRIRQLLYLAAMASIRVKGPLRTTYEALVARGKPRKSALGAVMRRLLLLMRALLIHETDYRADYEASTLHAAS